MTLRLDPIFICGVPKTGTTLLSRMFSNLPGVRIDWELHFASWMLQMLKNVSQCGAIKMDILDPMIVRSRELAADDFALFYDTIRDTFGRLHTGYALGCQWGNNCKPTIDYVPQVKQLFPESSIIFMLRDPRDVWASVKHAKWPGQEHFSDYGYFKRRFRSAYDQSLVPEVHTLLYRDLIANPQGAFDLIGREFTPACLAGTGEVFRSRTLPPRFDENYPDIIVDRNERFKTELSAAEIDDIEASFPDIIQKHFSE